MKRCAIAFRVHSGWTSLVAVALEKGDPVVLSRSRPHLVATFSYTFRQPYHTAANMSLDEAEAFLKAQQDEARHLAAEAITSARSDVAQQGYQITRATVLTAAGRRMPDLAKILSAHSLIHAADGEFFRAALLHAAQASRLVVATIKERELLAEAAAKLRRRPAALNNCVTQLGKPWGSPWAQDEKLATLAAWVVLCPGQDTRA